MNHLVFTQKLWYILFEYLLVSTHVVFVGKKNVGDVRMYIVYIRRFLSLSPPPPPLVQQYNATETNQLRMSAERVGAMLQETMEPPPARLAVTGAMVTAEQAGHYCVPVKLKRLYRERKLGSPFAKGGEERYVYPSTYLFFTAYRWPATFHLSCILLHAVYTVYGIVHLLDGS